MPQGAPPSRHRGSRTVTREPTVVRAVTTIRDNLGAQVARIRREEIIVAPADPARGEPATSATMANVFVTKVYRSGHTLFFDVSAGTGDASTVAAQLAVPALEIVSPPVTSPEGGIEQDLRLQLALPATWQMGAAYRVYVQAMRASGSDATTLRVLRAWQR